VSMRAMGAVVVALLLIALFMPCRADTGNTLAAQAANSGATATLLGTGLWDTTALDLSLLEGAYYSAQYSLADPRSVVQNFAAAYTALDGLSPDMLAVLSYDATRIMLQAIARAGVDDPALVRDEVAQIEDESVTGCLTFDENEDPIKSVATNKIE